ncbi:MAG: hypothetical protein WBX15_02790 [Thermoanaerobaculia bacterium]
MTAQSRRLSVLVFDTKDSDRVRTFPDPGEWEICPIAFSPDEIPWRTAARAMDAASHDWILLIHENEEMTPALAREIVRAIGETPKAWGYRIRSEPTYAGRPLRFGLSEDAGSIRLLHRRHGRFRGGGPDGLEPWVQGTVIRLGEPLRRVVYESTGAHRAALAATAPPHSLLRHILLFLRNGVRSGSLWRSLTTTKYLWIEAGFDRGPAGVRDFPGGGRRDE